MASCPVLLSEVTRLPWPERPDVFAMVIDAGEPASVESRKTKIRYT